MSWSRASAATPTVSVFLVTPTIRTTATSLKLLSINGVEPSAATVESGDYPLARPLFLYTTEAVLEGNPAVAAFMAYYLANLNAVVEEVGYFPVTPAAYDNIIAAYLELTGLDALPAVNPATVEGSIAIAGSSTVFPITRRMADRFIADGYSGEITVESVGSTAGLRAFCVDSAVDIVNASREINAGEFEACSEIGRRPVEIRIGSDALAVVSSSSNDYLCNRNGTTR